MNRLAEEIRPAPVRPRFRRERQLIAHRHQLLPLDVVLGLQVADDIGGGLVVLSSITPASSGSGLVRRQAPSQAPYYHVLIKGERLQPKPGRADDFGWPRVEPEIPEPEVGRRARPSPSKGAAPPRS